VKASHTGNPHLTPHAGRRSQNTLNEARSQTGGGFQVLYRWPHAAFAGHLLRLRACHALDHHAHHHLRWLVGKSSFRASSTLQTQRKSSPPASTARFSIRLRWRQPVKAKVEDSQPSWLVKQQLDAAPPSAGWPQTIRRFKLSVAQTNAPQP